MINDPIQAFLDGEVDMSCANEARLILRKIGNEARRTRNAIALVGHMYKATG